MLPPFLYSEYAALSLRFLIWKVKIITAASVKWYAYIIWYTLMVFSSCLNIIVHYEFGKLSFFKWKSYCVRDKLSICSVFKMFNCGVYGFLLPRINTCHIFINGNHGWTQKICSHCKWPLFKTAHLKNNCQTLQESVINIPQSKRCPDFCPQLRSTFSLCWAFLMHL